MFDSVYVFAAGLTSFGRSHTLRPANLSCDLEQPWQDGLQLYNHISSVSMLNVISFNKIFSPTQRRTLKKKTPDEKLNIRSEMVAIHVNVRMEGMTGVWLSSKYLIVEHGIILVSLRSIWCRRHETNPPAIAEFNRSNNVNGFCAQLNQKKTRRRFRTISAKSEMNR